MNRTETLIEITGGSGAQIWRLRYGTPNRSVMPQEPLLVAAGQDRAYYAHGGWLRLIDTRQGRVLGRWHFPAVIARLTPEGNRIQVLLEEEIRAGERFSLNVAFDPASPKLPWWPSHNLRLHRFAQDEAELANAVAAGRVLSQDRQPPEKARLLMPEAEEAARRDALTPWLQVRLGKLLRDSGDRRAQAVLRQALQVPPADYTELLPISDFLERLGEPELAREAYERGYGNFLERGNDPRQLSVLFGLLMLYAPFRNEAVPGAQSIPAERRPELIERIYKLSPWAEAANLAWRAYATDLERQGKAQQAQLWRARAEDAERNSFPFFFSATELDRALLVVLSAVSAGFLFLTVGCLGHRRGHQVHMAAERRTGLPPRKLWGVLQYWSRNQRLALLLLVLAGWYANGLALQWVQGILRGAAIPLSMGMGSFAGPATARFLETQIPATDARDLLLAIAYQQAGEQEKAEGLYRRLPQFAESWNNLGVLLRVNGKEQEARQAFEHALQMDPTLAEAALNLGQPPRDLWTELHSKFVPERPMLAPARRARMAAALFGGSPAALYLRALAGPFAGEGSLFSLGSDSSDRSRGLLGTGLPVLALVAALGFLLLVPSRNATQPPSKVQRVLNGLLPGTSPQWRAIGGLVLVAWCYLVLQLLVMAKLGTPYMILAIAIPSFSRAYGVPMMTKEALFALINPGWVWLYAAPALLFAINLVLVWRQRDRT